MERGMERVMDGQRDRGETRNGERGMAKKG